MLGLNLALSLWTSIKSWLPSALFTNNEQGAWYDPSDFSTMFQDSAGTTPVTAVEQPVGLILDKSKGLVLGPELVTNGDFSSGTTGWSTTYAPTLSIDGGGYRLTNTTGTNAATLTKAIATITGRAYKFSADVLGFGGGASSGQLRAGSAAGLFDVGYVAFGVGAGAFVFVATGATTYISVVANSNTIGSYGAYDNISVRELPGNCATQATSTKRPVLSARVNLLTKTEDFSDAVWPKIRSDATKDTTVAPNGLTTGNTLTCNLTGASGFNALQQITRAASTVFAASVYLKKGTKDWAAITLFDGATNFYRQFFNLNLNSVGAPSSTGWTGTNSIQDVGGGWYKCSVTVTTTTGTVLQMIIYPSLLGDGNFNVNSGDVGYIWGASLVPADQASLPYQRVNTATDYDTIGFPHYLKFDGVDDALATASIDFTATDKMTVVAGVRKLSAVFSMLIEFSTLANTINGGFNIATNYNTTEFGYAFGSRGTAFAEAKIAYEASPITNVIAGMATVSGDLVSIRKNGVLASNVTTDQGTGNYGNYPLYIGSRAGTSLPFNGHLYSLIVRGAQSTDAQIVSAETYVNSKTGAY